MAALKTTRYLDALNVFVGCVAALAVPVAIFSWYALVEEKSLSPAVAFTALAWITQMEWSINTLPDIYNLWSSLSPSVERLAEFLLRAPKEPAAPPPFPSDAAAAVDGAVGYGARAVATAKFECRRGEVVAVVGPVGAVDAHTGAALWERAIAPLAGRCAVVLATHQLAYAARPEVSRRRPRSAARRAARSIEDAKEAPAVEEAPVAEPSVETHAPARREPVALEEVAAELRRLLAAREGETVDGALAARLERSLLGLDGDEPERRRGGFIAYRDFVLYLDAFGSRATSASLAAIAVAACGCAVASNVWLSVWADDGAEGAAQTRFLVVYAAIGVLQAGLLALQTILLTLCALDASKTLHEKMLDGVLGAPLRFFDETPQGNALNRFLQDLANVDVDVPTVFLDQLTRTLTVASQLGLVLYFAPWVALMLPLALVPYGFIFSTVRVAARDTRRLEAAAHGPCYAHFNDALRGRETVAAFGALDRFCDANARLVEAMATGKYANDACSKWSQALTTMNGCVLYLAAGLCAVLLVRRGDVSTGQLGLVLLYAASLQRAGMDYIRGSMKRLSSRARSIFFRADNREEFGDADEEEEEDEEDDDDEDEEGEEPLSPAVAAEALDMNHVLRAEESGDEVGSFVWTPFPSWSTTPSRATSRGGREGTLFSVDVDLTRRAILKATLNEERLGLPDLVALLAHALAADQHPKANAPWIMGLLLSKGAARELDAVFEASLAVTPPPHAEVRRLVAHSRLVRFIVRLRGPFMRCFDEHREAFPASYSAEAYSPASWHRRRRRS
ncbi:ATPase [Aureococcus anophagefferens]|nr:ATPase [Aureococcus anophagefferens]